ncbi:AAA family ATPase [Arthrobacter yangruifuii]|uniref:AAA family ATPase n=1 Tax=Arthrobacter yangruifuii TaxID=2606616 RepID=UPI0011B52BDE|nr:AAA family ATPase [Arthrobacter yangruifuii]
MESSSPVVELIGRDEVLDGLCSDLIAGRPGAVILGGAGVGKTAVLRAVADRLQENFRIVPVRGTAISARTPYGALAFLLSYVPEGAEQDPLQLLQELNRSLSSRTGQGRVLVLVDNADRLDRFSIMVLSQLLRRGNIAVLATASTHSEISEELVRLWSEGLLERVELDPLTERQTRLLMQQLLDGQVSSLAAGTMWRETEGNPLLVRLLTPAQVHHGTLVLRDAVWVRTAAFVHTGEVSEVLDKVLGRLGTAERRLVEILAQCVSLPLSSVLEFLPASQVDALEEQQIISVAGSPAAVRLRGRAPGTVIAESIPPGRKRKLWEDTSALVNTEDLDGEELMAFVGWTLSCGEKVPPAEILRAARAANRRADPAAALRFVRTVPRARRSQELVLEEVRALHLTGHLPEAVRVLQDAEPQLVPQERSSYVPLMLLHIRTQARLPGSGDPLQTLAAVEGSCPAEGEHPELEAAVVMARSALAADGGCVRDVPDRLAELAGDSALAPFIRMEAAALHAHVLALAGRNTEALQVLKRLGPPEDYAVHAGNAGEVCTRIFDAYILTGELGLAADFVRSFDDLGVRPSYQGAAGELAVAVLAAWQGQDRAARDALAGALAQLRFDDPQDMLPLARVLSAYVRREEHPEAAGLPGQQKAAGRRPGYAKDFLLRYFSALTDNTDDGVPRLRAEVGSARAAGYTAPALLFLSAAVRKGDREAAAEVLSTAREVSGRFSELVADFAAGILRDDPALLVTAAKGFNDRGHYLLARDAAQAAEDRLANGSSAERKKLARTARALVNASLRRMHHFGSRAETLAILSQFEADLAQRAVTIATTTQIARELNLSPRTIEWHLGKIFAKLHVSGRSELAEILV